MRIHKRLPAHLARERLALDVVPPMDDQLVPELEHLAAQVADVAARHDHGRAVPREGAGGGLFVVHRFGSDNLDAVADGVGRLLDAVGLGVGGGCLDDRLGRRYVALQLAKYLIGSVLDGGY